MTIGVKSEGNNRNRIASILARQMTLPLAIHDRYGYSDIGFSIPKGKSYRGTVIGCHVCGATWKTLYKDGDQRICVDCKKKIKEEKTNEKD